MLPVQHVSVSECLQTFCTCFLYSTLTIYSRITSVYYCEFTNKHKNKLSTKTRVSFLQRCLETRKNLQTWHIILLSEYLYCFSTDTQVPSIIVLRRRDGIAPCWCSSQSLQSWTQNYSLYTSFVWTVGNARVMHFYLSLYTKHRTCNCLTSKSSSSKWWNSTNGSPASLSSTPFEPPSFETYIEK